MNDILALLNQGLQKSGALRTAETLGDRSAYIGMSDIARASDCLRAAVAGKLQMPKTSGACKSYDYQDYSQLQRELRLHYNGHDIDGEPVFPVSNVKLIFQSNL
jgi:hypothetical protein